MSHTKRILGEKCKSDSIDCDTVVLCKVQKHVGNNKNDINADFSKGKNKRREWTVRKNYSYNL